MCSSLRIVSLLFNIAFYHGQTTLFPLATAQWDSSVAYRNRAKELCARLRSTKYR